MNENEKQNPLLLYAEQIKEECENHGIFCSGCPFCDEEAEEPAKMCRIKFPSNWEV